MRGLLYIIFALLIVVIGFSVALCPFYFYHITNDWVYVLGLLVSVPVASGISLFLGTVYTAIIVSIEEKKL